MPTSSSFAQLCPAIIIRVCVNAEAYRGHGSSLSGGYRFDVCMYFVRTSISMYMGDPPRGIYGASHAEGTLAGVGDPCGFHRSELASTLRWVALGSCWVRRINTRHPIGQGGGGLRWLQSSPAGGQWIPMCWVLCLQGGCPLKVCTCMYVCMHSAGHIVMTVGRSVCTYELVQTKPLCSDGRTRSSKAARKQTRSAPIILSRFVD